MKDINEIIKVEHLKDFLKTLGYNWDGIYHNDFLASTINEKAEKFSDLTFKLGYTKLFVTEKIGDNDFTTSIFVNLDLDNFIYFGLSLKNKDEHPFPKNVSNEWIMYLVENCGRDYVNILMDKIDKEIEESIKENDGKNKELKKQINENNSNLKKKFRNIGKLTKEVYTKLREIENKELNK